MAVIRLSDLLPDGKQIKELKTGAELLLAVALNAYAVRLLDTNVICDKIAIGKELRNSSIYSYAFNTAYNPRPLQLSSATIKEGTVYPLVLRVDPIFIVEKLNFFTSDEEWVFSYSTPDGLTDQSICSGRADVNYVFLVAKWLLYRYLNPDKKPKLIIKQNGYHLTENEYAFLFALKKWGNAMFTDDLLVVEYEDGKNQDSEWVAYFHNQLYSGMTYNIRNEFYSAKDKFGYFKKADLCVGDVVLLYRRKGTKNSGNVTTNIVAAYPAVIRGIDEKKGVLSLAYCTATDLQLTRKYQVELLRRNGGDRVYRKEDYYRFSVSYRDFDINHIGINGYSTKESWLIIPPVPDDSTMQWINDGVEDKYVKLNTLETIYALFEDRGVKYSKERFLNRYFPNQTPIWEQYKAMRESKQ